MSFKRIVVVLAGLMLLSVLTPGCNRQDSSSSDSAITGGNANRSVTAVGQTGQPAGQPKTKKPTLDNKTFSAKPAIMGN